MIKCNVTVIGTVNRPAELKEDRNGNPFVTFGLNVLVKDRKESKNIDISVACDGEEDFVLNLSKGERVKAEGTLTFKRRGDVTYFNMSADSVSEDPKEEDQITGTIQFKGTLGGKDVTERKGKKGSFRVFDAYSSEKISDEEFSYIWVHFIDFSDDRPEWLAPRKGIEAGGDLELQVYNGSVSLNCRADSLSEWVKDGSRQ